MYYAVDLYEISKDLTKEIESYLHPGLGRGRFLHIKKDSLEFFRAYEILTDDYELIDTQKLKEILLVKHLRS